MESTIHSTSTIYPDVIIGNDVYIGPNCIIGAPAEDKKNWGNNQYSVIIKDGAVIHGNVTVDSGTIRDTVIGENAWLMKAVHIGHDSIICRDVILSPHVLIGGHCTVNKETNMGMGAKVHNRKSIPNNCMFGMGAVVTKQSELKPYGVYIGVPVKYLRKNVRT